MWRQSAHGSEASGLAAGADVVRLRLSARDRLWLGVRWLLGLAGAVVVLWVGAAFLAATPAAAAAVVPMAAAQGLQKGGITRLMSASDGGDDSDGGSGGKEKKSEKKDKKKEKKSDKKEKKDKKSEKKKDKSDKKDDQKEEKGEKKEKSEKKDDDKKKDKKSEARESQDDQDKDQARHDKRAEHEQADKDKDADRREKDDRDDADRRKKSDREKSDRDDADRDEAGARHAAHKDDGSDIADHVREVVRDRLQDAGTERGDSEKSTEGARDDDADADDTDADARDTDEAGKGNKAGKTAKGDKAGGTSKGEKAGKSGKGDKRDEADGERADRRSDVARLVAAKLSDHEGSDASDEGADDRSDKQRAVARALEDDEDHGGKKKRDKKKRDEEGRAPPGSDDDVRHLLREVGEQLDGAATEHGDEDGAKKQAKKKRAKKQAKDETRESTGSEVVRALRRLGDSEGKDGDSKDGKDSVRDVVKRFTAQLADRDENGERSQRAREDRKKVREKNGKKDKSERRDGEKLADAVRGLVREAVEYAADRAGVSKDEVDRAVDSARKRLRDADGDQDRGREKAGKSGKASEKAALAKLLDAAGADGDRKGGEKACKGGKGCSASALRKREASLLSSRGPPKGERARKSDVDQLRLLSASDEDDDSDRDGSDRDEDADDSAEKSERVLEGRIDVDKSKSHLAGEKKKVAAGEVTADQYKKDKAKHDRLVSRYKADRSELSSDRADLIDDVVDGQRGLDKAEKKLAAEEKNVAAGKVAKKAHDRNVAKFEKQRDKVYDDTEDLMDATDRDARVVPDDGPDGEGAVAGCGSDGAFVECGSSSESGDGKKDSDRDLCVSGVSSGCGASSRSGDSSAEASCDDSGCGSKASSRGEDGKISKASARCSGDARNCGQHSLATTDGASGYCDSGGGSCRSDSTGPDRDAATPPDPGDSAGDSRDRKTAASAACTGDCAVDTVADRSRAESDCDTAGGSCDSSSTGSGDERPDVRLASTGVAEDGAETDTVTDTARRQGASTSHCESVTGCGTSSSVDLGDESSTDEVVADAGVDCAGACTGSASSSSDAGHETGAEKAAVSAAAAKAPKSATNGKAACTVSGDGGCSTRSTSNADGNSGDDDSRGTAGSSDAVVEVDCGTGCTGKGSTSTAGTASGVRAGAERTSTGSSSCEATGSGCQAYSNTEVDNPVGEQDSRASWLDDGAIRPASLTDGDATAVSSAGANVDCGDGPCGGAAKSATTGTAVGTPAGKGADAPVRTTKGSSNCTASGGGCAAESSSQVSDGAPDEATEPSWSERLTAAASGTTLAIRELAASSAAGSELSCLTATCAGAGSSRTSGGASGDVKGVRDSTGSSSCAAHGAGGSCTTSADTTVADRDPADAADAATTAGVSPVSGPVSVSNAVASVACSGAVTECGGTAKSSTSARDTAVTPHARGTSASAECTVTGGGCAGDTRSAASSSADYVAVDPNTGKPLPGQSLSGPSSTSSSSASLACQPGVPCSGSVRTSTAAWDGAVAGGKPRTSEGTASCTGGTGGCQVQSASGASTGPGAELAFSGPQAQGAAQQVNLARMPAGPSAASVAGAALTCEGKAVCTGKVTSAATATDPSVSPDPRGSHSEGSCEGVSGGVCQAVTNSGAATGPNANSMAPLVQARSTENATVSSGTSGDAPAQDQQQAPAGGQDQPAVPPAPTAPGSSANSGGPTVPGASSWTMASATLDCAGSTTCEGTARSSASGSDGPKALEGAGGARGPPEGSSSTSASCASGQSGCQAQTSSSAGSGQVVADIVAEQNNDAAKQAKQQATEAAQAAAKAAQVAARPGATAAQRKAATDAAKTAKDARKAATDAAKQAAKQVTDAPASISQSSAAAQCAGAGCTATTTGDTSGFAGTSHTEATCTAAQGGCTVTSDATAMSLRDSGERTQGDKKDKDGKPIPGYAVSGETGSNVICPQAGCTGTVTGKASVKIEQDGRHSTSTGEGKTACDGTGPCEAGIRISSSAAVTAPGVEEDSRFAATSVTVAASCDNGTKAGCSVHARSNSDATGSKGVRAKASAACDGGAGCLAATSGTASSDLAQVSYQCGGAGGCIGHSEGTAKAGKASANARSDCRAAANGQCSGSSMVGASTDGSAMAGASCQGTAGATCGFHFEATAFDSSRDGTSSAKAYAHGSQTGEMGGGAVQVAAKTYAKGNGAQAQAMCQGTGGVKCGYHFEATASSSSRDGATWATAYAHGSESGGMGGGAVQVMAQTYARGPDANAQAICKGAKNCTSTYAAHAEAHDRQDQQANPNQPDMPSGYWSADGSGTCRGSGKGGCGVHAWANAGPGGSGGARCSGDCSGFVQEQGGPSTFTKTGPSWNEMLAAEAAARRAREAREVKDIDEVVKGLKPGDSFLGYKKGKDGYTIYKKEADGKVTTETCPASKCKPGYEINGGNGNITFPQQGNPQTTQQSKPGKDPHKCDASVGCALTNDGKGNGKYWIEGDGTVHDGITGSTMYFKNSKPAGSKTNSRNAGSFGNTKGAPFTFTCNGGCKGDVSNIELGKGKFTDHIDLEGTPNLLIGRDGLGNLGNYAHYGKGTITLQGRDGKMMDPIKSTGKDGLTAEKWADVTKDYGYTPWDLDTISKVLESGDSLIGFRDNGNGNYTIYTKEPNGKITKKDCSAATKCAPGEKIAGGRGAVSFPKQGDPTARQTSAPGRKNNTCTANVSCGLATDGNGNGMWWLEGNGQVHDGITGSELLFKDSRPSGGKTPNRNGGNFANTEGTPFTFTCNGGCKGDVSNIDLGGKGKFTDHIDLEGTSNGLFGRDGFGNPGDFSHFGQGVVTLQVGKDGKDVITSNGDGLDEDDWSTIITRSAASGAGGIYDISGGQTYEITLAEGYRIKQTDKNRKKLLHPDPVKAKAMMLEAEMHGIKLNLVSEIGADNAGHVITPNANGKGGVIECVGLCDYTRPKGQEQTAPCTYRCEMRFTLGTGEGPNPLGTGMVKQVGPDGESITLTDPYGNKSTGYGIAKIVQRNGEGGGQFCESDTSCVSTNVLGHTRDCTGGSTKCGEFLLNPITKGKYAGRNTGSGCMPGEGGKCGGTVSEQVPDLGWRGFNDDGALSLYTDQNARRTPTDLPIDQELKKNDDRYKQDGMLPFLTPEQYDAMPAKDKQSYLDSLEMNEDVSPTDQGLGVIQMGSHASTAHWTTNKVYGEKKEIDAAVAASKNGTATPEQRKLVQDVGDLVTDFNNARRALTGAESATGPALIDGHRPISKNPAEMTLDPRLMEEINKIPGNTPTNNRDKQMSDLGKLTGLPYGVTPDGKPAGPDGKPLPAPTPEQLAKAGAAQVLQASMIPRWNDHDGAVAKNQNRIRDINAGTKASQAERNRLNADLKRLEADKAYLQGVQDAYDKLGGKKPNLDPRLRDYDAAVGNVANDPAWAKKMKYMGGLQDAAGDAAAAAKDRGDKDLALSLSKVSVIGGLGYETVIRDPVSRSKDNRYADLRMPSTGASDLYFAMRSGKYLEEWTNHKGDYFEYFHSMGAPPDEDGNLTEPFRGKTVDDRLAEFAAEGSPQAVENKLFGNRGVTSADLAKMPEDALSRAREIAGKDGKIYERDVVVKRHSTGQWEWVRLWVADPKSGDAELIDQMGNHFNDLLNFQENNPWFTADDKLVAPKNLTSTSGDVQMGMHEGRKTPMYKKVGQYASLGLTGVGTVLSFTPIAPVGWGMVAAGVATGAGTSVASLANRGATGQDWAPWSGGAATMDWINIGASALAVGGIGARLAPAVASTFGKTVTLSAKTVAIGTTAEVTAGVAFTGMYVDQVATYMAFEGGPKEKRELRNALLEGTALMVLGYGGHGVKAGARGINNARINRIAAGPELRPELGAAMQRPLINRINDVVNPYRAVDVDAIATHLSTADRPVTSAEVRGAIESAPKRALRFRVGEDSETGAYRTIPNRQPTVVRTPVNITELAEQARRDGAEEGTGPDGEFTGPREAAEGSAGVKDGETTPRPGSGDRDPSKASDPALADEAGAPRPVDEAGVPRPVDEAGRGSAARNAPAPVQAAQGPRLGTEADAAGQNPQPAGAAAALPEAPNTEHGPAGAQQPVAPEGMAQPDGQQPGVQPQQPAPGTQTSPVVGAGDAGGSPVPPAVASAKNPAGTESSPAGTQSAAAGTESGTGGTQSGTGGSGSGSGSGKRPAAVDNPKGVGDGTAPQPSGPSHPQGPPLGPGSDTPVLPVRPASERTGSGSGGGDPPGPQKGGGSGAGGKPGDGPDMAPGELGQPSAAKTPAPNPKTDHTGVSPPTVDGSPRPGSQRTPGHGEAGRPDAVDGTSTTDPTGARGDAQRPVTERAEEGNQARPETPTEQDKTAKEAQPGTDGTLNSTDRTQAADQGSGSREGAGHPAGERKTAGDEVTTGSGPDHPSAASASDRPGAPAEPAQDGQPASADQPAGVEPPPHTGARSSGTPVADRARNDQSGSGQEHPAGLTEKDHCGPVACARVKAKDQGEVDPEQISARPDQQETGNVRGTLEELGGQTKATNKEQHHQDMAEAPVGTKVVVWVWNAGAKVAHLIYGEKTRDGVRYYDNNSKAPLTKAEADAALADTQMVTSFEGGKAFGAGKASTSEASLPRYVGAKAERPHAKADLEAEINRLREDIQSRKAALGDELNRYVELFEEAVQRKLGHSLYEHQRNVADAAKPVADLPDGVRGLIAEVRAGGGKTLSEALMLGWLSLDGRGVHALKHDEQAAAKHSAEHAGVLDLLGIKVKLREEGQTDAQARDAYDADATVVAMTRAEHDHLADQQRAVEERVQRHAWAVADEVDGLLAEDARSPSVLAQPTGKAPRRDGVAIEKAVQRAEQLEEGVHYTYEEVRYTKKGVQVTKTNLQITKQGKQALSGYGRKARADIKAALTYRGQYRLNRAYVLDTQALRIKVLNERNGRANGQLRFNGEAQRFLEAWHDFPVRDPQRTVAAISRQKYLENYDGVVGLTGTAKSDAALFWDIYRMRVVEIETPPSKLKDEGVDIYVDLDSQLNSIADRIAERMANGQPVEVVVASIPVSQALAAKVAERGIDPAKIDAVLDNALVEQATVAGAGRTGAVTLATLAGGRSVDIKLGGDPNHLKIPASELAADKQAVSDAGGLYAIDGQFNETGRMDGQVRGRPARSDDPGSYKKVLSLDDETLRKHASPAELEALRKDIENHQQALPGRTLEVLEQYAPQAEVQALRQAIEANGGKLTGASRQRAVELIDKYAPRRERTGLSKELSDPSRLGGSHKRRALELFEEARRNAQELSIRELKQVSRRPHKAGTIAVSSTSAESTTTQPGRPASSAKQTLAERMREATAEFDRRVGEVEAAQARLAAEEARAEAGAADAKVEEARASLNEARQRQADALRRYEEIRAEARDADGTSSSETHPTTSAKNEGVAPAAVDKARGQVDRGDYSGAANTMAALAAGAGSTTGPDGRSWIDGLQTRINARLAATVLSRLANAGVGRDVPEFERRQLEQAWHTLDDLLATLPAGAVTEVATPAARQWYDEQTAFASGLDAFADQIDLVVDGLPTVDPVSGLDADGLRAFADQVRNQRDARFTWPAGTDPAEGTDSHVVGSATSPAADGAFSTQPLGAEAKGTLRSEVPTMPRRDPTPAERQLLGADLDPTTQVLPSEQVARLASGELGPAVTGWDAFTWTENGVTTTVVSEDSLRDNRDPAFWAEVLDHERVFHRPNSDNPVPTREGRGHDGDLAHVNHRWRAAGTGGGNNGGGGNNATPTEHNRTDQPGGRTGTTGPGGTPSHGAGQPRIRGPPPATASPGEPVATTRGSATDSGAAQGFRPARYSELASWNEDELRELLTMWRAGLQLLAAIWKAQGMDGRPTPVTPADRARLLAEGHLAVYRGLRDPGASQFAEQFRAGDEPFVGVHRGLGGSGHNFSVDPATAGGLFTRSEGGAGVVLTGYLHRNARVVTHLDAMAMQSADIDAARQRGDWALAAALEDLGIWAALNGFDAVVTTDGTDLLVQNRTALFIEVSPEAGARGLSRVLAKVAGLFTGNHSRGHDVGGTGLVIVIGIAAAAGTLVWGTDAGAMAAATFFGLPFRPNGERPDPRIGRLRQLLAEVGRELDVAELTRLVSELPSDFWRWLEDHEQRHRDPWAGESHGGTGVATASSGSGTGTASGGSVAAGAPERETGPAAGAGGTAEFTAGRPGTSGHDAQARAPPLWKRVLGWVMAGARAVAKPVGMVVAAAVALVVLAAGPALAQEQQAPMKGAEGDTPALVAQAYGVQYGEFVAFNAKKGVRFAGPNQLLEGREFYAPADVRTWHVLSGGSLWEFYYEQAHDPAAYRREYDASTDPQHFVDEGDALPIPARYQAPAQEKPGEDKPGEDKPGEDKPGQDKPGQDQTGDQQGDRSPPAGPGLWAGLLNALSWLGTAVAGLLVLVFTPRSVSRARRVGFAAAAAGAVGVVVGGALVVFGPGGALVAGAAAVAAGVVVAAVARSGWTPRQIRAPTRAQINAWARAVRGEVTGFWLDVRAGLELAWGGPITTPASVSYWVAALRWQAGQLWRATTSTVRFLLTPTGLAYVAIAAVFAVSTGAMMIWAVPAVLHMVGFQLRGTLNAFKKWLSQHPWVKRGGLTGIIATLGVNIPFHIRGALNTAAPDSSQWVAGLFGVAAVTTVIWAITKLVESVFPKVRFPAWWDRFIDRLGTVGAAATLASIPFMVWAVVVHPDFDGVVTIHPVVFWMVVATFTGFGGEALLHLAGTLFKRKIPEKLTKFWAVYSAVTIAVYGMLYQLHQLPVLVVGTSVTTLAGLLHFVLTRPYLSRADKARQSVVATGLAAIHAFAANALFLGRPEMSTATVIVSWVAGVATTVAWIWTIRGPTGGGSAGPSSGGPASPGGPAKPAGPGSPGSPSSPGGRGGSGGLGKAWLVVKGGAAAVARWVAAHRLVVGVAAAGVVVAAGVAVVVLVGPGVAGLAAVKTGVVGWLASGFGVVWGWLAARGGLVGAVGAVVVGGWLLHGLRWWGWQRQLRRWRGVVPVGVSERAGLLLDVVRVLVGARWWGVAGAERGFTVEELAGLADRVVAGEGYPDWLVELAGWVGTKTRAELEAALAGLAGGVEPLLSRDETGGVVRFGVSEVVWELLARGPPQLREAFLRDPVKVLGDQKLSRLSADDLAALVFEALRTAWFKRTALRLGAGWRGWLPLSGWRDSKRLLWLKVLPSRWWPGRLGQLLGEHGLMVEVRAQAEAVRELRNTGREQARLWAALVRVADAEQAVGARLGRLRLWWALRALPVELRGDAGLRETRRRELHQQLWELRQRLEPLEQDVVAALRRAWSQGALDGLPRRQVGEAAEIAAEGLLGAKRAGLLGFISALPSELAKTFTVATAIFAAFYGVGETALGGVGNYALLAAPVFGLVFAAFSGRIKTLAPIMLAGVVGAVGVALVGLGAGLSGLIAAVVLMSFADAATGLLRAQYDTAFPAVKELAQRRAAEWQTGFKAGQLLPILLLLKVYAVFGVAAGSLGAAAVLLLAVGGMWWLMRDGEPALPRGPPPAAEAAPAAPASAAVKVSTRGIVPRWWALVSMPVGTMVTGFYMYALLGGMIGLAAAVFAPGDQVAVWLVGSVSALQLLTALPRWLAVLTGTWWPGLHKFLGTAGRRGSGSVDEARVLVGVGVLGWALVPVAAVVWLVPGLGMWPALALMVAGAVLTGWARVPHTVWAKGSKRIQTLINSGKSVPPTVGPIVGLALLGGPAQAAIDAATEAARLAALSEFGFRLVFLTVVVALLPTLWGLGVQRLRIAPLGELTDTLPVAEAKVIDAKLREADLLDVGTLKKVFLDPAPTGREAQRQRLQQILTDHERALLIQALRD